MRVLIVAPQDHHSSLYLATAFRQAGHSVTQFDYRAYPDNYSTMIKMLMQEVRKADFTLILKGESILPTDLRQIHPSVLWNFDGWYANSLPFLEKAKSVDVFFTPCGGLVKEFRDMGISAFYLTEAASPEVHHPESVSDIEQKEYGSSVSFIGTVNAEITDRDDWLKAVGERYPLKIWGSFPGPLSAKWHTGMRAGGRPAEEDDVHNRIVSASKVVLDKQRNPDIRGVLSARVYRTLAARGFLLMRHVEGIEDQFVPGKHVATFETTTDCLRQLEYYLGEGAHEREKIAVAGYVEVMSNHTWLHRVRRILELI